MSSIGFIIASNLKKMREASGMTQEKVAGLLGKSQSRVSSYENGETPDVEILMRFCDIYSIDANSLLSGGYPKLLGEVREGEAQQAEILERLGFIMIPMVDAVLSAGLGSFEVSDDSERKYAFRSDFLHRKGSPASMVLMRVDGDSMAPRICHGDAVLIDQSQKALRPGQIYAVGVEAMVFIKIVSAQPGKVLLHSLNSGMYPPLEVDTRGDLEDSVRIVGRCVWSCREL